MAGRHWLNSAWPLGGTIAVAAILTTAAGTSAEPKPRPVTVVGTPLTHMGRLPGDHVALRDLRSTAPPCSITVRQLLPDNSHDFSARFVVPDGKLLVLTDVEAVIVEGGPAAVSWEVGFIVRLNVAVVAAGRTDFHLRPTAVVSADIATGKRAVVSTHSQSGIVVGPGAAVCLLPAVEGPGFSAVAELGYANLQGYLIDE